MRASSIQPPYYDISIDKVRQVMPELSVSFFLMNRLWTRMPGGAGESGYPMADATMQELTLLLLSVSLAHNNTLSSA